MRRIALVGALILLTSLSCPSVHAADFDLVVFPNSITFQPSTFFTGRTVRIYATVDSVGTEDVEGTVVFETGGSRIGTKPISIKAGGRPEEAWINWTPQTAGTYTISVQEVNDADYPDATPGDNIATRTIFVDSDTDDDGTGNVTDPDDDNDGVVDTHDDYPTDPARDTDTDGDGIDDSVDSDDDNDGLFDYQEGQIGTNPLKRDTDGDHVGDKEDAYPLDPTRSDPEPAPTPVVTTEPVDTSGGSVVPTTTSGSGSTDPSFDGRVLGEDDAVTTTTDGVVILPVSEPPSPVVPNPIPATASVRPMSWWTYAGLLGLAALFLLASILFFWLDRKRKKQEEGKA